MPYVWRMLASLWKKKQKQERCRRCHGGHLHATLDPNELKCNYCGWSKTEINLKDYIASNP